MKKFVLLFGFGLRCFLGAHHLDGEKAADDACDTEQNRYDCAASEPCYEIADEADACHAQGVGQLGVYMVHVVAFGARARHDGRVGNRRNVVSANGARHAGGNAYDHEVVIGTAEGCDDNRDEDSEGSPGGSRGKGEEYGDAEDDGGHQVHESGSASGDEPCNEVLCAECVGDALEAPCENEDEDCGYHGLETFWEAFEALAELENSARQVPDDGEDEGCETSEDEAYGGVARAKCVDKSLMGFSAREESARVDEADKAENDEAANGEDEIQDSALCVRRGDFLHFVFDHRFCGFELFHGPEFDLHDDNCEKREYGEKCVEVVWNGLDEKPETVFAIDEARDCGCPGTDGCDNANRGCRGVNQVRKLFVADFEFVCNGAHHAAYGEAVEVVVHKNQDAKANRCNLCSDF